MRADLTPTAHDEGLASEVTRPGSNPRPDLAPALQPWLASSLDDPAKEPEPWEELAVAGSPQRFEDESGRVTAWLSYLDGWRAWARQETRDRPSAASMSTWSGCAAY